MADDLYDRDALAWAEHQAALLRRVARGELVNGVDWDHVVEEIEDVGISDLRAVRSYLRHILVHLLKLHGWPELDPENHWRSEIAAFQADIIDAFAPSMRQRIDLDKIYDNAERQVGLLRYGGEPGLVPPETCPVTLDQLLTASIEVLEAAFSSQATG